MKTREITMKSIVQASLSNLGNATTYQSDGEYQYVSVSKAGLATNEAFKDVIIPFKINEGEIPLSNSSFIKSLTFKIEEKPATNGGGGYNGSNFAQIYISEYGILNSDNFNERTVMGRPNKWADKHTNGNWITRTFDFNLDSNNYSSHFNFFYVVVVIKVSGRNGTSTMRGYLKNANLKLICSDQSYLDLNCELDGQSKDNIANCGTASVKINGQVEASDVTDFWQAVDVDSTYEIYNFKPKEGIRYDGKPSYSGTIGNFNVNVCPPFHTLKRKIYIGDKPIKKVYIGEKEVKEIYVGNTLVYG